LRKKNDRESISGKVDQEVKAYIPRMPYPEDRQFVPTRVPRFACSLASVLGFLGSQAYGLG
jgi:hypothetical protein